MAHNCIVCGHILADIGEPSYSNGCQHCHNAASALKTSFLEASPLPHLSGGWSGDSGCSLKKLYSLFYPIPFDALGVVEPGTQGHEYEQNRLPTGTILSNKYEICSHEQLVRYDDGTPRGRRSPIDTLVFNRQSQQYESWDYKFVRPDMKYQFEASPKYIAQSNLFAYCLKNNWNLPYNPIYRIIYCEKINYAHKKEFMFEMNEELALETIKRFKIVNITYKKYKDKPKLITKKIAKRLANGLNMWYRTKTQRYRSECRYCHYVDKCSEIIGFNCPKGWENQDLVYYSKLGV